MRSHFNETFDFLDTYLPTHYVSEVSDILEASGIEASSNVIRNVKNKRTTTNLKVLNALQQLAEKYRDLEQELTTK